jgi:predicted dinucleotide-binding enzyme
METVAQNLGDLDGKIVIDVSFPWTQAADGYAESLVETSSAELIQAWNPGAKVVKGLTTMGSKIIDDPMAAGGLVTIPVASDHRDAKERVAAIVVELGLDPVDVGPLRMARAMEAMDLIYMTPILQRRTEEWEFFFRRNAHFVCVWEDDWTAPVYDAGNLAEMPETQKPPVPCP